MITIESDRTVSEIKTIATDVLGDLSRGITAGHIRFGEAVSLLKDAHSGTVADLRSKVAFDRMGPGDEAVLTGALGGPGHRVRVVHLPGSMEVNGYQPGTS